MLVTYEREPQSFQEAKSHADSSNELRAMQDKIDLELEQIYVKTTFSSW